jgi:ribosomal-protein-alanine N-acetyltransferase
LVAIKAPDRIDTARLTLRRPCDTDADAIFSSWASDPAVTKFMSWSRHESPDDAVAFIQFSESEWVKWPAGPYLIEIRDTGEAIGSTGFGFQDVRDAEVGSVLAGKICGRGDATEARGALIELAPQLGLARLHAPIHADNTASARVLEKCGFSREHTSSIAATFPNLPSDMPSVTDLYSRAVALEPLP